MVNVKNLPNCVAPRKFCRICFGINELPLEEIAELEDTHDCCRQLVLLARYYPNLAVQKL